MNAITPIIRPDRAGLLTPSVAYKPFRYPWAFDMWKKQQQVHWMPEEVPLGEDVKDWASTLNDNERNLLTQIFRFFTQADIEVQDNYMERYGRVFKPTEVKMMLAAFGNMETIHIAAYALLLETIGMPESEFGAFMEYEAMRDKHDYMGQFGVDSDADICRTLAMFGGFSEGVQLFASFAMLMNFPRHNKMKGMGQIVSWSVRDESLHCEGIIKLFHTFVAERDCLTKRVRDDIMAARSCLEADAPPAPTKGCKWCAWAAAVTTIRIARRSVVSIDGVPVTLVNANDAKSKPRERKSSLGEVGAFTWPSPPAGP